MTAPDPLPTEEEAERFFTEVPPARSAAPASSTGPQPAPTPPAGAAPKPASTSVPGPAGQTGSTWSRLTTPSPTTGVAPREWLSLVAGIGLFVFLVGHISPAQTVPAWRVPDGACTNRRVTSTVNQVLVTDCADAEARVRVTARFSLPEGPYPGRDAAVTEATRTCTRPSDDSRLGVLVPVVPSSQEWDDGTRLVLCTYLVG